MPVQAYNPSPLPQPLLQQKPLEKNSNQGYQKYQSHQHHQEQRAATHQGQPVKSRQPRHVQVQPAPYSFFNEYEKGDLATFDALSGPNKQLVGVYDGQGGWHLRNDDGSTGPKLILHGHPHVHAEVTPAPYNNTASYQAGDFATFADADNPGKNLIGVADGQGGWHLRQRGAAGAKLTLQPMGTSARAKITPDPYDKEKDYLPGDLATFTSFSNPNNKLVGISGLSGWYLRNDDGSAGPKLTIHGSQAAVNIFDMDNSSLVAGFRALNLGIDHASDGIHLLWVDHDGESKSFNAITLSKDGGYTAEILGEILEGNIGSIDGKTPRDIIFSILTSINDQAEKVRDKNPQQYDRIMKAYSELQNHITLDNQHPFEDRSDDEENKRVHFSQQ